MRAEDLIEYAVLKGSGAASKATQKLNGIQARKDGNSPTGLLAYALAEKLKGNNSESIKIIDTYVQSQNGNAFAKWCKEMIERGSSTTEILPEQEKIGNGLIRILK